MHAFILLLERLLYGWLLDLYYRCVFWAIAQWLMIWVMLVLRIILPRGNSRDGFQSTALDRLNRTSSLRCSCQNLWIGGVYVGILDNFLSFIEVILEFLECLRSSQSRFVNLLHLFPNFLDWKIDEVLSRPSLTYICQMLRVAIALYRISCIL